MFLFKTARTKREFEVETMTFLMLHGDDIMEVKKNVFSIKKMQSVSC